MAEKTPVTETAKTEALTSPATASARLADGIGAYSQLAGPTHLDLSKQTWDQEKEDNDKKLWRDSPQGRLAIRSFSRGVLGAAFFTGGQRYAGVKLSGYNPKKNPENWVQGIAKAFDTLAGRPIEFTLNALGADGKRAVTFRPTRKFYGGQDGRSLGHEVVGVTFDFASMSVGDAMGRDIAGIFDPNAKLSWLENGHINYPQTVKSLAFSGFRYLTYNQGEDWAVALPYVYYLRAQRNMINKFSPGFGYDSDRSMNGGSFKVNDKGQIVGNYNLEGMIDLQGRFTAYNVGTVMFREAYTQIADALLKKREGNVFDMPDPIDKPGSFIGAVVEKAKSLVRWTARDSIKASIYMTPSMPFFWGMRTTQTKFRGLYIHPEHGAVAFKSGPREYPRDVDLVHAHETRRSENLGRPEQWRFSPEREVFYSKYQGRKSSWEKLHLPAPNPSAINGTDFDGYSKTFGPVDTAFNELGKFNNTVRKSLHNPLRWLEDNYKVDIQKLRAKRMTDTFINASLSYTPYFWSKAEFARLWDNARMDQSIEGGLDALGNLDPVQGKKALNDVWHSLTLQPLADAQDEATARERIRNDVSPADIFDPLIFEPGHRGAKKEDPAAHFDSATAPAPSGTPLMTGAALQAPKESDYKTSWEQKAKNQGTIERLLEHKAHAQNRMDHFRRSQQHGTPTSFVESVKPRSPESRAPDIHYERNEPIQRHVGFAEKEEQARASRDASPSTDTIH